MIGGRRAGISNKFCITVALSGVVPVPPKAPACCVATSDVEFSNVRRSILSKSVRSFKSDSFAITNIDLIKIDVEGYEMEVLKGANQALEQCTYVLIELNNNSKKYGSSNGQITKYLTQKGFSVLIKTWPDVVFVNNYSI